MENQEELNLGVGTLEAEKLQAKDLEIAEVTVEEVGEKKSKKVVLSCKHPDSPDPVRISSIKLEKNQKLVETGLWLNKDKEGKIQKGSPLATLMTKLDAPTLGAMVGKAIASTNDSKGYLCIKLY